MAIVRRVLIWWVVLFMCSLPPLPLPEASPLCANRRAPLLVANSTRGFCATESSGGSCCDAGDDAVLRGRLDAMRLKPQGDHCSHLLKSMLCAECNPFSADLFHIGSTTRTVPLLCSSASVSEDPIHPKVEYCELVWKFCKDTAISNSPFQSVVKRNDGLTVSSSMITDFWHSEIEFCEAFSGTSNKHTVCFNGHGVSFNSRNHSPSFNGICLEKISNGSYLNMVAHPDGSNKAFLSREDGKVWLATVPGQGKGDILQLDVTSPFLDIATEGHLNSDIGLVGLAFHPDFSNNGRFFVSYICDGTQSPNCAGRCSCDCEVGCDPSKLGLDIGVKPCRYNLVVSEYSAKGSSSKSFETLHANPSEVRRIFSMGLPYASNHAGQLLFGPTDGYLYFFTGNGGMRGDPFNFSQNKISLLGKVMRLNIDDLPEPSEIANQSLWGNYTIPKDNPSADHSNLRPEIWALGFENPWRCSFDYAQPSHLYCVDDGQEEYKVVDLISKGGNYGWGGSYDDQHIDYPPWEAQGTKPTDGIIFPIMGYKVHSVTKNVESALIVGGYVYRGSADPWLYGRYLFADMHTSAMWAGSDNADGSGKFTFNSIPMNCSKNSPIPCEESAPLGSIFSFGEDNNKDIFILASNGVYRVVHPTRCDYASLHSTTAKGVAQSTSGGSDGASLVAKIVAGIAALLAAFLAACGFTKFYCQGNKCCINFCNG